MYILSVMTSISAWNEMMEQFLGELEKTFPEEKAVKKYKASFDLLKKSNPRKCIDGYMTGIGPYQEKIMAKDESFFVDSTDSFLSDLNIKKHWTSDLSSKTKDAIWQYIQTLFVLGTTITMIPAEALGMIEDVAQKCAGSMESSGQMDEKALTRLFSSLGNMLGGAEKK
jgi:hypothetical protein